MQKIDVHGLSLRGSAHRKNHDHFAVATLSKSMRMHQTNLSIEDDSRVHGRNQGHLFLVADGISGAPAPARASGTAVDGVVQYFLNEMPWSSFVEGDPKDVTQALNEVLESSQAELFRRAIPENAGMGTTMTLAFVFWPDLYVAHVGDSRCYLSREGRLRQLTTDHTVAELRRELGGRVTERSENTLWNAVGGQSLELNPQVTHTVLHRGDVLTLVTDGVSNDAGLLEQKLDSSLSAEDLCSRLVEAQATDDQTAVVVRFLPLETSTAWAAVPDAPLADGRRAKTPSGGRTAAVSACPKEAKPSMRPRVGAGRLPDLSGVARGA